MLKFLKIFSIGGSAYCLIEFIYRLITDPTSIKLTQSISMFIVGGLCVYIIGLLNEKTKIRMIYQSIIGTSLILLFELLFGIFLNIYLRLDIWDYSDLSFNIMGQVSLLFGFVWLFLTPFSVWVDDMIREHTCDEEDTKSLWSYYKRLFLLK